MEFTAEHVEKAVKHFYSNLASQSQLNLWLTSAQSSPLAWSFAWQLLDKSKILEVQYFGASTLQTKIAHHFHEIPPDHYPELRQKLIDVAIEYVGGPKIVIHRLSVAISYLILHSVPDKWQNPFADVEAQLARHCPQGVLTPPFLNLLLTIITGVAEEFSSMNMTQVRRTVLRAEMSKSGEIILPLLSRIISTLPDLNDPECDSKEEPLTCAIKAVNAWVQYGVGVPWEHGLQMIGPLMKAVEHPSLEEVAIEAVTQLVIHPEAHRCPASLLSLLEEILPLKNLIVDAKKEGCPERLSRLYGIFVHYAETHSRLLINSLDEKQHVILPLFELLLDCTNTPGRYPVDENYSHLPLSVWYILQDDLNAVRPEKQKVLEELFTPLYLTLVDVLLSKAMLPEFNDEWSAEDKETHRCYRQDLFDTMGYCFNVLRGTMLEKLLAHLADAIRQNQENPRAWPALETCLMAIRAVSESVETNEEAYIPKLIAVLPSLPFRGNTHIIQAALETLGAYAEWLSAHPTLLGQALPLLMLGLENGESAPAASLALKEIARDCVLAIRPYAESIVQSCEKALFNPALKNGEKIRLMYILGKVLSVLPIATILQYLNQILGPCLQELHALLAAEANDATRTTLANRLQMVATLCCTLDLRVVDEAEAEENSSSVFYPVKPAEESGQQPVFLLLQQMLPLLKASMAKYPTDEHVVQATCSVLKQCISNLLDDCMPLLPELVPLIAECHRTFPSLPLLEVTKQLMLLFGKEEFGSRESALLHALLVDITQTTLAACGINYPGTGPFPLLPSHVPTDGVTATIQSALLAERPDLLGTFMLVMSHITRKNVRLLTQDNIPLRTLFIAGIVGLTRPEPSTFKPAAGFLSHFLQSASEAPPLKQVVDEMGQLLVSQILACIGGSTSRQLVEYLSEVFLQLSKKHFPNYTRWLQNSLAVNAFPSSLVQASNKEQFLKAVLKERANKRKLQDIIREFSLVCRGLAGTEYSEATSQPTWS